MVQWRKVQKSYGGWIRITSKFPMQHHALHASHLCIFVTWYAYLAVPPECYAVDAGSFELCCCTTSIIM